MTNQKRQPKGAETGGQFAASTNPESNVDLAGEFAPDKNPESMAEEFFAYYKTLPLKELRRRQGITSAQFGKAFEMSQSSNSFDRSQAEKGTHDLQIMEDALARAVDWLTFPELRVVVDSASAVAEPR